MSKGLKVVVKGLVDQEVFDLVDPVTVLLRPFFNVLLLNVVVHMLPFPVVLAHVCRKEMKEETRDAVNEVLILNPVRHNRDGNDVASQKQAKKGHLKQHLVHCREKGLSLYYFL